MKSTIYNLNGNDRTLILGPSEPLSQSFKVPNWTDLRLTLAVSATKENDPNDPTGLVEDLGTGEDNEHVYIGFKSYDSLLPPLTNFWGISTSNISNPTANPTKLMDSGLGYYFWQNNVTDALFASNGTTKQKAPVTSTRVQNGAGIESGYASIIMLRMIRNDPTQALVDLLQACVTGTDPWVDNGLPFDTDTTVAHLRALTAAATFTTEIGPFPFTKAPDAIYCFWPFTLSRLRIHSYVLEKYA